MKKKIKKLIKRSIYKSLIVTLLFISISLLKNFELVREKFEDAGFDLTSKMFFSTKLEKAPNAPPLLIFGFDDLYMQKYGLFDEDNRTNYGYLFPREHIAKFIKRFDKVSHRLDEEHHAPQALFLDMDVSFGSNVKGNLSAEDEALLDILENDERRPYTLIFPKIRTDNFIEQSTRPKIVEMIADQRIVFSSVGFTNSKDNATRRYISYKTFHNPTDGNRTYPHVALRLWNLAQKRDTNLTWIEKHFSKQDIVENRILFKQYQTADPQATLLI